MARGWRCKCGGYNTAGRGDCRDCGGPRPGITVVAEPSRHEELPLPLDAPQLTKAERLKLVGQMIRVLTLTPRDIPLGGCARHPDGCGRSGIAWNAVRSSRQESPASAGERGEREMAGQRRPDSSPMEEPDEPDTTW
jgi:hypothetical protein